MAATPAIRERYVDFLRAMSILAVVVGHWVVSTIYWQGGVLYLGNAVGLAKGLWLATWVLQVMPIFFFVGGFSNYVAYEASKPVLSTHQRSPCRRAYRPALRSWPRS